MVGLNGIVQQEYINVQKQCSKEQKVKTGQYSTKKYTTYSNPDLSSIKKSPIDIDVYIPSPSYQNSLRYFSGL